VAEQKDEDANRRANDLRGEVMELEREVAMLKADREEDRRRRAQLEKELGELQDHVIEQHDKRFDLVVKQVTFFYKIPNYEGNFDIITLSTSKHPTSLTLVINSTS